LASVIATPSPTRLPLECDRALLEADPNRPTFADLLEEFRSDHAYHFPGANEAQLLKYEEKILNPFEREEVDFEERLNRFLDDCEENGTIQPQSAMLGSRNWDRGSRYQRQRRRLVGTLGPTARNRRQCRMFDQPGPEESRRNDGGDLADLFVFIGCPLKSMMDNGNSNNPSCHTPKDYMVGLPCDDIGHVEVIGLTSFSVR
jgi:hypothetical protein